MNNNNVIPPIPSTHGGAWKQPDYKNFIDITDTHVTVKKDVFVQLPEYSTTMPTGVHPGKLWRAHNHETGLWYLCWYGEVEVAGKVDESRCSVNYREVIFQEMIDLITPHEKF